MKSEAYITKGVRVRVDLMSLKKPGEFSLAGVQFKLTGTRECFDGIVRHIWADDPKGTKNVRLQLERDDGTLQEVPIGCVVGVLEEGDT
jgi:hypothetical protein